MFSIIISSVIGLSLVFSFVRNNFVFETIIISTSRLCTIVTYSFMELLVIEYFSAEMISVAFSFQAGFSEIGIIVIPYIIVMMNDLNIHPAVFSSFAYLILGLVPLLFLKETLNKNKNKDEITN